ncbi:MAG: DUF3500 domain-containing protein [Dehalococcoidia bacterium]
MTSSSASAKPRLRPILSGRGPSAQALDRLRGFTTAAEASLAEPFRGITSGGSIVPGLFPIESTDVSTRPLVVAAEAFLGSLGPEQAPAVLFPLDSDMWRRWSNVHMFSMRHGALLEELPSEQRDLALALLRESLSHTGYETARDVMKLNETIREMTGRDEEYGEWLYWLSIMGTPSANEPWGWQIDGHHLIVNCFVQVDQIVMTPLFMGSEPVIAEFGRYAGTRVFQQEEQRGLALIRSFTAEQRATAILSPELPREVFTTAFRDNFELRYEGICWDRLSQVQRDLLLALIQTYVGRMRPGHAEVKLEEVRKHLHQTYFAWMGSAGEDGVFYYRLHSPVILIEFDHLPGIALDNDEPSRNHIHTVVRTPNGNDYGKDLLRQHHERFDHWHLHDGR